jgi:hypothetical protein
MLVFPFSHVFATSTDHLSIKIALTISLPFLLPLLSNENNLFMFLSLSLSPLVTVLTTFVYVWLDSVFHAMNLSLSTFHNLSTSSRLEPCPILKSLGIYLSVLWILGTYLNGSILLVFLRHKQLRQTSTNIFIAGLLLADFIGACFEIPLPAIALLSCRSVTKEHK